MNRPGLRPRIPSGILSLAYAVVLGVGVLGGSYCLLSAAASAFHVSGARLTGLNRTGHGKSHAVAALIWHLVFATVAFGLGFRAILLMVRHLFIEALSPPASFALFGALAAVVGVGLARLSRGILLRRRFGDGPSPDGGAGDGKDTIDEKDAQKAPDDISGIEDIKAILTCIGVGGAVLFGGFGFLDPAIALFILMSLLYSSVANAYLYLDVLRRIRG
jgi:hypothetical protein